MTKRQPPLPAKACAICATSFTPPASTRNTCSKKCAKALKSKRRRQHRPPLPATACVICSAPYTPHASHQQTCSKKCSTALKNQRRRPAPRIRACACRRCGNTFEATRPTLFCSDNCSAPKRHCVICGGEVTGKGKRKVCEKVQCQKMRAAQRLAAWKHACKNPDPNNEEPQFDEHGEFVYVETPRRKRLLEAFKYWDDGWC